LIRWVERHRSKIWIVMFFVLVIHADVSLPEIKETLSERVPDVLVFLYPEKGNEYAIVVEKDTQRLFLYGLKSAYKKIYDMKCSTGEVHGTKTRAGDKKTPEGVYFFTKQHKKQDLAPIYGARAFPIDYPNLLDRIAGRDGNSIWMHGTNKSIEARGSNGCIVLENDDIDNLAKYITLNRTPVIIVNKLTYATADSVIKEKKSVLGFLSKWNEALVKGTYHDYLKFYDSEYVPDISWWSDWNQIRKRLKQRHISYSVDPKKISILKHHEVYTVLFDQVVQSSGKDVYTGTRKLFLTDVGAGFRITGEEYQVRLKAQTNGKHKNPLVAACFRLQRTTGDDREISKKQRDNNREIAQMIDAWLKAWSSKDIKRYGAHYARDFHSQGGADLKTWLKYKDRLNRKYDFIQVSEKNLVIKRDKNKSTVYFVQTYASNQYKAVGMKRLVLKREGTQWKIYRESWKKM
jgi:murein L,D-transpeptidase YafK